MTEESLDRITSLSSELVTGFTMMAEGVGQLVERFKALPFMARPFAQKDFELSIGFEPEEWHDFLKRLTARLEQIRDAASTVKEGKPLETLKEASAPFLERVDLVAEKVRAFQRYMEEAPKKIEKVPKMFISDKDREQIKQAPEAAIMIGKAADGLLELRDGLKQQLKT